MTENLAHIHPQLQSLAIEVDALTPDPKNARKHDRRNIDAIKASLSKFGFRAALVAQRVGDSLIVRAGNGRLQAARELGFTHVPVLVFDEGDDEAVAYAIADNRTAELAEWDWQTLGEMIDLVPDDLRVGWEAEEVRLLLAADWTPPEKNDDAVFEAGDGGGHSGAKKSGALVVTFNGEHAARVRAFADRLELSSDAALLMAVEAYRRD